MYNYYRVPTVYDSKSNRFFMNGFSLHIEYNPGFAVTAITMYDNGSPFSITIKADTDVNVVNIRINDVDVKVDHVVNHGEGEYVITSLSKDAYNLIMEAHEMDRDWVAISVDVQ